MTHKTLPIRKLDYFSWSILSDYARNHFAQYYVLLRTINNIIIVLLSSMICPSSSYQLICGSWNDPLWGQEQVQGHSLWEQCLPLRTTNFLNGLRGCCFAAPKGFHLLAGTFIPSQRGMAAQNAVGRRRALAIILLSPRLLQQQQQEEVGIRIWSQSTTCHRRILFDDLTAKFSINLA